MIIYAILLIIATVVLIATIVLVFKQYKTIKANNQIITQKKIEIDNLEKEKSLIEASYYDLENHNKEHIHQLLEDGQKQYAKVESEIQEKISNLNSQYEEQKKQIDILLLTLNSEKEEKEKAFSLVDEEIAAKTEKIYKQFNSLQELYQKEQEEKDKKLIYTLQISLKDLEEIESLLTLKRSSSPAVSLALSKVVWSTFVQKRTTELCNRVVGANQVTGIYKITNNTTHQIYIGQATDIASRWKDHIKCGLGIDASLTSKLYNNMQEYGVWNFSFDIVERCQKSELNERERYYISLYQSDKYGLNMTKGNK